MALLSGGPARELPANWRRYPDRQLYTYSCVKIDKKKFFSYNIYGFSINRIYILQFVYLGFSVESRSEKTVHNAVNRGGVRSKKKKFFETFCLIS